MAPEGQDAQEFRVPTGKIVIDWFCLVFFVGGFVALYILLAVGPSDKIASPKVLLAVVAGPVLIGYSIRLLLGHVGVTVVLKPDGLVKRTRGSSEEVRYREVISVVERRRYEGGLVLRTRNRRRVLIPFAITGYPVVRECIMSNVEKGSQ